MKLALFSFMAAANFACALTILLRFVALRLDGSALLWAHLFAFSASASMFVLCVQAARERP